MNVFYISPSIIPSRTANAVHVVHMCDGLRKARANTRLFFGTELTDSRGLAREISDRYGVDVDGISLKPVRVRSQRALALRITLRAVLEFLRESLKGSVPDVIFSRNLYAAVLFACACPGRLIYETHQIETGLRGRLQGFLVKRAGVFTVVISDALRRMIADTFRVPVGRIHVAHDAVNDGLVCEEDRVSLRQRESGAPSQTLRVGYFGHLFKGRGIEVITGLAMRFPDVEFLVYGGSDELVAWHVANNPAKNCHFMGFVTHAKVTALMRGMDVLLMPYQRSVSIEASGRSDTAKYMSPMKMFEYMASGVPFIASRLPVLEEVLGCGRNCLLADPENIEEWSERLREMIASPELRQSLAVSARQDVIDNYTWVSRAQSLLGRFKDRTYGEAANQHR